jgi:hypothetical protein
VTPEELLTAPQAAQELQLSLGALYAYRRRWRIPNAGRGRRLLFRRSDLLRARPPQATVMDFEKLARQHARGERLRA